MATRRRLCRKCGDRHSPPTGQRCSRDEQADETNSDLGGADQGGVMAILTDLKKSMESMASRLEKLEEGPCQQRSSTPHASANNDLEHQTANSLRQDADIARRVRLRLEELNVPGACSGEDRNRPITSNKGKTTGSTRTADDLHVQKDVTWPHFYVRRGSERRPVVFDELTLPEFVYGFLAMIEEAPENQSMKDKMLFRLKEIMRDCTDFDWVTMKNFFRILMQDIEKGKLSWGDDTRIQEMRVLFIHRLTVERQAPTASGHQAPIAPGHPAATASGHQAKAPLLFCLSFQEGTCQYNFDHSSSRGPLKHMCAFCYRMTGNAYPHREIDCKRKIRQQSKNEGIPPPAKPN